MTDHISDANKKSPLDELIAEVKLLIYEFSDGSSIDVDDAGDILEGSIRIAVEKHSEAVMPKQYDKGNGFSECIDEIKQKSDEFRGLS